MTEYDAHEVMGPRGPLAGRMAAYEYRPQQIEMSDAVWHALTHNASLLVEAGPGTGKTFAYLIASLYSGKKIVVSTGTKNLQDQLYYKDIPFLQRVLPVHIKAAYMKGRENYLCRRRFENFRRQPLFLVVEEHTLFREVEDWARHTKTGDRDELKDIPEVFHAWSEICCRRDYCAGSRCPEYARCFLTRMRQEAADARLVIVNHHLFCADLALRGMGGEVIPRYDGVIFDEAHQLEEVATSHFGASVSTYRVEELTRDVRRELFPRHDAWEKAQPVIDRLLVRSTDLFSLFAGEERYRLRDLDPMALNCLSEVTHSLSALRDLLNGEPWTEETAALIRRTRELGEDLEFILSLGDPTYVYWCEHRGRGTFLSASPIEVGRELHTRLYSHVKTLIFTSATLCTDASFDYVRQRLAIPEARELAVESPFALHEQVVLYVPDHLPEPWDPSFPEKAGVVIEEILRITRGRAFVLCTSHRSMHDLYQRVRTRLPYTTLLQGERPKHVLLEEFKTDVHSVLFATASFWEGVDVPGEALSCVIIDKLPFDPPTEPIVQARIERLQSLGINPFFEYQIPTAIITLKQGLGRLIRSTNDRGVLAILDPRLHTRPYGSVFFASLPQVPLVKNLKVIKKFFL